MENHDRDAVITDVVNLGMAPGVARRLAAIDAEELARQVSYLPFRDRQDAARLRQAFDAREPAPEKFRAWVSADNARRGRQEAELGACMVWAGYSPAERLKALRIAFCEVPAAVRHLDRGRKGRMLRAAFGTALRRELAARWEEEKERQK